MCLWSEETSGGCGDPVPRLLVRRKFDGEHHQKVIQMSLHRIVVQFGLWNEEFNCFARLTLTFHPVHVSAMPAPHVMMSVDYGLGEGEVAEHNYCLRADEKG
jgi:hypothetical protein